MRLPNKIIVRPAPSVIERGELSATAPENADMLLFGEQKVEAAEYGLLRYVILERNPAKVHQKRSRRAA